MEVCRIIFILYALFVPSYSENLDPGPDIRFSVDRPSGLPDSENLLDFASGENESASRGKRSMVLLVPVAQNEKEEGEIVEVHRKNKRGKSETPTRKVKLSWEPEETRNILDNADAQIPRLFEEEKTPRVAMTNEGRRKIDDHRDPEIRLVRAEDAEDTEETTSKNHSGEVQRFVRLATIRNPRTKRKKILKTISGSNLKPKEFISLVGKEMERMKAYKKRNYVCYCHEEDCENDPELATRCALRKVLPDSEGNFNILGMSDNDEAIGIPHDANDVINLGQQIVSGMPTQVLVGQVPFDGAPRNDYGNVPQNVFFNPYDGTPTKMRLPLISSGTSGPQFSPQGAYQTQSYVPMRGLQNEQLRSPLTVDLNYKCPPLEEELQKSSRFDYGDHDLPSKMSSDQDRTQVHDTSKKVLPHSPDDKGVALSKNPMTIVEHPTKNAFIEQSSADGEDTSSQDIEEIPGYREDESASIPLEEPPASERDEGKEEKLVDHLKAPIDYEEVDDISPTYYLGITSSPKLDDKLKADVVASSLSKPKFGHGGQGLVLPAGSLDDSSDDEESADVSTEYYLPGLTSYNVKYNNYPIVGDRVYGAYDYGQFPPPYYNFRGHIPIPPGAHRGHYPANYGQQLGYGNPTILPKYHEDHENKPEDVLRADQDYDDQEEVDAHPPEDYFDVHEDRSASTKELPSEEYLYLPPTSQKVFTNKTRPTAKPGNENTGTGRDSTLSSVFDASRKLKTDDRSDTNEGRFNDFGHVQGDILSAEKGFPSYESSLYDGESSGEVVEEVVPGEERPQGFDEAEIELVPEDRDVIEDLVEGKRKIVQAVEDSTKTAIQRKKPLLLRQQPKTHQGATDVDDGISDEISHKLKAIAKEKQTLPENPRLLAVPSKPSKPILEATENESLVNEGIPKDEDIVAEASYVPSAEDESVDSKVKSSFPKIGDRIETKNVPLNKPAIPEGKHYTFGSEYAENDVENSGEVYDSPDTLNLHDLKSEIEEESQAKTLAVAEDVSDLGPGRVALVSEKQPEKVLHVVAEHPETLMKSDELFKSQVSVTQTPEVQYSAGISKEHYKVPLLDVSGSLSMPEYLSEETEEETTLTHDDLEHVVGDRSSEEDANRPEEEILKNTSVTQISVIKDELLPDEMIAQTGPSFVPETYDFSDYPTEKSTFLAKTQPVQPEDKDSYSRKEIPLAIADELKKSDIVTSVDRKKIILGTPKHVTIDQEPFEIDSKDKQELLDIFETIDEINEEMGPIDQDQLLGIIRRISEIVQKPILTDSINQEQTLDIIKIIDEIGKKSIDTGIIDQSQILEIIKLLDHIAKKTNQVDSIILKQKMVDSTHSDDEVEKKLEVNPQDHVLKISKIPKPEEKPPVVEKMVEIVKQPIQSNSVNQQRLLNFIKIFEEVNPQSVEVDSADQQLLVNIVQEIGDIVKRPVNSDNVDLDELLKSVKTISAIGKESAQTGIIDHKQLLKIIEAIDALNKKSAELTLIEKELPTKESQIILELPKQSKILKPVGPKETVLESPETIIEVAKQPIKIDFITQRQLLNLIKSIEGVNPKSVKEGSVDQEELVNIVQDIGTIVKKPIDANSIDLDELLKFIKTVSAIGKKSARSGSFDQKQLLKIIEAIDALNKKSILLSSPGQKIVETHVVTDKTPPIIHKTEKKPPIVSVINQEQTITEAPTIVQIAKQPVQPDSIDRQHLLYLMKMIEEINPQSIEESSADREQLVNIIQKIGKIIKQPVQTDTIDLDQFLKIISTISVIGQKSAQTGTIDQKQLMEMIEAIEAFNKKSAELSSAKQSAKAYKTIHGLPQKPDIVIPADHRKMVLKVGSPSHEIRLQASKIKGTKEPVQIDLEEEPEVEAASIGEGMKKQAKITSKEEQEEQRLLEAALKIIFNEFVPENVKKEIGKNRVAGSEEVVGAGILNLLPDILHLPILRNLFALPIVENMLVDSVRSVLSLIRGYSGQGFIERLSDGVIRSGIKNVLDLIKGESDNGPIKVEEHQLRDGQWVVEEITLPPPRTYPKPRTIPQLLRNIIVDSGMWNILGQSRSSENPLEYPIIENVVLETLKTTLQDYNIPEDEPVDDSLIREIIGSAIDDQPDKLMELPRILPKKPKVTGFHAVPVIPEEKHQFKSEEWIAKHTLLGKKPGKALPKSEVTLPSRNEDRDWKKETYFSTLKKQRLEQEKTGFSKSDQMQMTIKENVDDNGSKLMVSSENPLQSPRVLQDAFHECLRKFPILQVASSAEVWKNSKKMDQRVVPIVPLREGQIKSSESLSKYTLGVPGKVLGRSKNEEEEEWKKKLQEAALKREKLGKTKESGISQTLKRLEGMDDLGSKLLFASEETVIESPLLSETTLKECLRKFPILRVTPPSQVLQSPWRTGYKLMPIVPIEEHQFRSGEWMSQKTLLGGLPENSALTLGTNKFGNKMTEKWKNKLQDAELQKFLKSVQGNSDDFDTKLPDVSSETVEKLTLTLEKTSKERFPSASRPHIIPYKEILKSPRPEDYMLLGESTEDVDNNENDYVMGTRKEYVIKEQSLSAPPMEEDLLLSPKSGVEKKLEFTKNVDEVKKAPVYEVVSEDSASYDDSKVDEILSQPQIRESVEEGNYEEELLSQIRNRVENLKSLERNFERVEETPEESAIHFEVSTVKEAVQPDEELFEKNFNQLITPRPDEITMEIGNAEEFYPRSDNNENLESATDKKLGNVKSKSKVLNSFGSGYKVSNDDSVLSELIQTPRFEHLPFLGRIAPQNRDLVADEISDFENTDLYYIGDGVRLPLVITKLKDGSFALSLSARFCDRIINEKCPCCVPKNGNIVQEKRRRQLSEESFSSGENFSKSRKSEERGSGDKESREIQESDSTRPKKRTSRSTTRPIYEKKNYLQLFKKSKKRSPPPKLSGMSIEGFAKKYNLSLNLGEDFSRPSSESEGSQDDVRINFESNDKVQKHSRNSLREHDKPLEIRNEEKSGKNWSATKGNESSRKSENLDPIRKLISINEVPGNKKVEVVLDALDELMESEPTDVYTLMDGHKRKIGSWNRGKIPEEGAGEDDEDIDKYGYQVNNPILKRIKFIKKRQNEEGHYRYQRGNHRTEMLKTFLHWLKEVMTGGGNATS
ncbi:uncharacterized protein LOC105700344 [Orussus abietinus]|uniref:uncharacterized protein LOC105700344 n=1 Tax=Orussus abietinus TaxID=222816 RepID=UPI000626E34D|nr:uncharacterized protein LOC105700344 [Orussus abietinus]